MNQDILFEIIKGNKGKLGSITLNRPDALNAITHDMILALDKQLIAWADDDAIKAVVIRANGDKAFSAGGDIRDIYERGKANDKNLPRFFWDEYRLNRRIHHYPKPYVSLIHGIVMGGGVGVSMHGSHRVGAENLSFAMPETGIGFFPDVGGSYLLSRCPGSIGIYLGLTGERLNIDDTLYCGLLDYHVPFDQFDSLIQALAESTINNAEAVSHIIKTFSKATQTSTISSIQSAIDASFSLTSVEKILSHLSNQEDEWSQKTAKLLLKKSPSSLKVTLEEIQRGELLAFDACMQMEYRLVNRFIKKPDFYEGVRALIIDKDKSPEWEPNRLELISKSDVNKYFENLRT